MPAFWQDALAGLAAVAALAYLVRRRLRASGAACEGCEAGGCAPEAARRRTEAAAPRLVRIEGPDGRRD